MAAFKSGLGFGKSILSKITSAAKGVSKIPRGKKLTDIVSNIKNRTKRIVDAKTINIIKEGATAAPSRLRQSVFFKPRNYLKGGSLAGTFLKTAPPTAVPYWAGRVGLSMAGGILKHPKVAFTAGIGMGVMGGTAKAILSSDERTQSMNPNKKGMPHNNLSSDGLTLSLSKTRHRR